MKISLFSKIMCIGQIAVSIFVGVVMVSCLIFMRKETFGDGVNFIMYVIGCILCGLWLWMGIVMTKTAFKKVDDD